MPLLWTVYALVTFREFREIGPEHEAAKEGFYERPPSYRLKEMHESSRARLTDNQSAGGERVLPMDMQDDFEAEW